MSLKLAGGGLGMLGEFETNWGGLELAGLIWNELGESGTGRGFWAVWVSLKLAGEIGDYLGRIWG